MPTTQPKDSPKVGEQQHQQEILSAFITKQVLHSLGKPPDLFQVQCRMLWENHYRVNILVGENATTTRIANSFFLQTDNEGNIAVSKPKIANLY